MSGDDKQSCWKTAKHPEKRPREKCVSKAQLCDLKSCSVSAKIAQLASSINTRETTVTLSPDSRRSAKQTRPSSSQNQLCASWAAERPSTASSSHTLQHTLQPLSGVSGNSRLVQLKIFSSGVLLLLTSQICYLTPGSPTLQRLKRRAEWAHEYADEDVWQAAQTIKPPVWKKILQGNIKAARKPSKPLFPPLFLHKLQKKRSNIQIHPTFHAAASFVVGCDKNNLNSRFINWRFFWINQS